MPRSLVLTLVLLTSAASARAQADEFRIPPVSVPLAADDAYDRALDYVVSHNYVLLYASRADRFLVLWANTNVEFGGEARGGYNYRRVTLRFAEREGGASAIVVGHHTERVGGTARVGPDQNSREAAEAFLTAWLADLGQPSPFPASRR